MTRIYELQLLLVRLNSCLQNAINLDMCEHFISDIKHMIANVMNIIDAEENHAD